MHKQNNSLFPLDSLLGLADCALSDMRPGLSQSHCGAFTPVNTAERHAVCLDTAIEDQPHIYSRLQQDFER